MVQKQTALQEKINKKIDRVQMILEGYCSFSNGLARSQEIQKELAGDAPFPACLYPIKRFVEIFQSL